MSTADLLQVTQSFLGRPNRANEFFSFLERERKENGIFLVLRGDGTGYACHAGMIPFTPCENKVIALHEVRVEDYSC